MVIREFMKKIMGKIGERKCPRIDVSIPEGWSYETLAKVRVSNGHVSWMYEVRFVELTGRWRIISYPKSYILEVECKEETSEGIKLSWVREVYVDIIPNKIINECSCVGDKICAE